MTTIFSLGSHPFADTFIPKNKLHIPDVCYPLNVQLDSATGEIKTEYSTDAESRYNLHDYSYTSSNSKYSRDYWSAYADFVKSTFDTDISVLEIGCNDGFLMQKLLEVGVKSVHGLDASSFMVDRCKSLGLTVEKSFFIEPTEMKYDLIIANNVVNHSNDIHTFFNSIKKSLSSNGKFVFEVPYWKNLVDSGHIDQIYHEHVYYFTAKYVKYLCELHGLKLYNITFTEYHGGSIRFYISNDVNQTEYQVVNIIINDEINSRLFDISRYEQMNKHLLKHRTNLLSNILHASQYGKVIGVGAAAKANTLINYLNLDNKIIHCVTDMSPDKIGKYTPLSRIPIVSDDEIRSIYEGDVVYVMFLAWNIAHILKPKYLQQYPKLLIIDI